MTTKFDSDTYETPPWLFELLAEAFGPFFWDACCDSSNCLIPRQKDNYLGDNPYTGTERLYDYLTLDLKPISDVIDDGMDGYDFADCDDKTVIFMNPPYSRGKIGPMMEKAWEDAKHFRVVCLVRDDPSTKWYQNLLAKSIFSTTVYSTDIDKMGELKHFSNKCPAPLIIIRLPKRIKFYKNGIEEKDCYNFPVCVVVMDRRNNVK